MSGEVVSDDHSLLIQLSIEDFPVCAHQAVASSDHWGVLLATGLCHFSRLL